ncbi:MAG: CPBP family intramembrane metalloprotease [Rhodanobacteraceae bacterium]|jgi:membrane protease YdiL (CAAX protease family)|nr:CPBP family intramembrane metalloprotease [Rhodanobacteraceae bacterium]
MRYVGVTLAVELVLGCVITLASVIGSVFAPLKFAVVTHYHVTESPLIVSAMEARIRADWPGPGTATVRPMSSTGGAVGGACGPHTLELETTVRGGRWSSGTLLAEIERAANQIGLGTPCDGAQIRMRPVFTWQAVMVTGTSVVAPLLLFLVWCSRRGRPWLINWADWTPRVDRRGALRWGITLGGVAIVCGFTIEWLGQLADFAGGSESMQLADKTRSELLWLAPLFVVGAPIFEEYVFRAWMLERFRRVMPAWLALVWTALAFAAMHVPQGVVPALELASGGLLLGLTWLWTRSWLACALAHGVHNGAVLMALLVALPS